MPSRRRSRERPSLASRCRVQTLARVLDYSAGITKIKRSPGGGVYFRAAPNTGALYHVDLYLTRRDLPDLPGLYHFGVHDFALRRLRVGDYRGAFLEAAAGESSLARAPVVVASASTYWRNAWKYRERAYRHAFWDAGTLHANLLAVAAARGVAAKIVAGFADRDIEHLLGLDPAREGALALVPLGRTAEPPVPAPDVPVLNLEIEPLSFRERPTTHRERRARLLHLAVCSDETVPGTDRRVDDE